ncbi:uncharacterized protein LOC114737607 [Neltuma alba]|uniref:uncharacterized protein LOC114737607 n=1 Tax=Neltuma alba TaxID=207710 RepID=UPI0010A47521|nr:uncharacterized protein LOC114737607 [Prosopis alba]
MLGVLSMPPVGTYCQELSRESADTSSWSFYRSRTCNAMTNEEASASPNLIRGNILLEGHVISALFDSGATHSFISVDCAQKLSLPVVELPYDLRVSTPAGVTVVTGRACLELALQFENRDSTIDLFCLPLKGIDVIIGMNWLMANGAILDCKRRLVTIPVGALCAELSSGPVLLSAAQVEKAVRKGCQAFIVFFSISEDEAGGIEQIAVVRDYPKCFQTRLQDYLQSEKWSSPSSWFREPPQSPRLPIECLLQNWLS